MYDKIIKKYIENKFNLNDVIKFAKKENCNISIKDAELLYIYVKNYWQIIYKGDPSYIFNDLRNKIEPNTYQKMIDIYKKYKSKINNF